MSLLPQLYREVSRIERVHPSNLRIVVDLRNRLPFNIKDCAKRAGVYLRYTPGFRKDNSNYVTLTVHHRGV